MYLMPEDGLEDRNIQHVLTRLIKSVGVNGRTYDNFKREVI
jgi:hypothetical protein